MDIQHYINIQPPQPEIISTFRLKEMIKSYELSSIALDNDKPKKYNKRTRKMLIKACRYHKIGMPDWLKPAPEMVKAVKEINEVQHYISLTDMNEIDEVDLETMHLVIEPTTIDLAKTKTAWDINKAMDPKDNQESLVTPIDPQKIPLKITSVDKNGQLTWWWVQMQPRDWHGHFLRTGRKFAEQSQKPDKVVTRVKRGAMVMYQPRSSKPGVLAQVVKVLGKGQFRTYQIKLGPEEYKIVDKTQIIKPHYTNGGLSRDMVAGSKESEPHERPNSTAEGIETDKVNKLVEENIASIINEGKVIYGKYTDMGMNLSEHGIPLEDLISEAKLMAYQHTPKWRKSKGEYWPFIQSWIQYGLRKYIGQKSSTWGMINMPRQRKQQLGQIKAYRDRIKNEVGVEPSKEEIVAWAKETLKLSSVQTLQLLDYPEMVYSLYSTTPGAETAEDGHQNTYIHKIIDTKQDVQIQTERKIAYENIVKYLDKKLSEKQSAVIKIKFGLHADPDTTETSEMYDKEKTDEEVVATMNAVGFTVDQPYVNRLYSSAIEELSKDHEFKKLLLERNKANEHAYKHYVVV